MFVDYCKCGALLEGIVERGKGRKVSGFEWFVEMVVDYGIQRKEGHVLKEFRVGQQKVG